MSLRIQIEEKLNQALKAKDKNIYPTLRLVVSAIKDAEIAGRSKGQKEINDGDIIDIISTNKSVYGYLSINGGFKLNKIWGSYSTTVRARVGPNEGNKITTVSYTHLTLPTNREV